MAKVEIVVKEIKDIVLTLNEDEAKVLSAILGRVGGMPITSPRGLCDKILVALYAAGISEHFKEECIDDRNNSIYFNSADSYILENLFQS